MPAPLSGRIPLPGRGSIGRIRLAPLLPPLLLLGLAACGPAYRAGPLEPAASLQGPPVALPPEPGA